MAFGTGHGATALWTTSTAFAPSLISIGSFETSRPRLDTSHLGTTTNRTFIPGDLREVGTFDITVLANVEDEDLINVPYTVPQTLTITFPKTDPSSSVLAKYAGSAFVVSHTSPEVVTDTLLQYTFTVSWASAPAFTEET